MKNPASLDWIYKRDGRLVAFEADRISQSLFAAGESLNRPDAFTARELTDGVLHFLSGELNGAIPKTAQVAHMICKDVRQLGQASIAQAYAEFANLRSAAVSEAKRPDPALVHPGKAGKPQERAIPQLPSPQARAQLSPRFLIPPL